MVYLPKGSIMQWNGNKITEHNRSAFDMTPERFGTSQRMANTTLRTWTTGTKWTFTASWKMLPADTAKTVDGAWGGRAMETFYKATTGAFTLLITHGNGTTETFSVVFTDFDKSVTSRGGTTDAWDVSVTLEEV